VHDDLICLWTCLWRWGAWLVLAAHRWKLLCVSSPYLSQDDRIRLTSHQTRLVCDLTTSRVLGPSIFTWHWWTVYKSLLSKYPHKLLVMSEGSVATHLKAHIMRLAVTKRVSHYQSWRSQIINIFHWQILNQYSQFHTMYWSISFYAAAGPTWTSRDSDRDPGEAAPKSLDHSWVVPNGLGSKWFQKKDPNGLGS
jgi:hypothetical protein